VFGKTGEGKSYMLNHTFFHGNEMFSTIQQDSSIMTTCTNGAWAAYDPVREIILFDTAGWLGMSATDKLHMRHLLKVSNAIYLDVLTIVLFLINCLYLP